MSGKLFRNLLFLFIINVVIKPIWIFGIDIPAQNKLGHVVFGEYASLLSLSLIFQILLDIGLQTYQSRQVGSNRDSISWLLPNSLVAKSFFSVFYLCILLLTGWLLDYSSYSIWLLFLLGVTQVFNSLMLYLRASISSLHYYAVDSVMSIIDKLVVVFICGSILYFFVDIPFRIEHLIFGQMIGYVISGIICAIFIWRKSKPDFKNVQWKRIKMIVKKSYIYAILILVMAVFFRVDTVILEKIKPNTGESGYYWEVYRLLDMMNNFTGILFAGLYLPMVMKFKKNKVNLIQITQSGIKLLLPISFVIVIISYFFHAEIMNLLYKDDMQKDTQLLFLMMLSFPFYSLNYIYSTFLSAMGEIKSQIIHALICALLVIILNLLYVDTYGAQATAIISAIGHSMFFILNFLKVKNKHGIHKWPKYFLVQLIAFIGIILMTSYYIYTLQLNVYMIILLVGFISIISILLLKIIHINDIKSIWKERG